MASRPIVSCKEHISALDYVFLKRNRNKLGIWTFLHMVSISLVAIGFGDDAWSPNLWAILFLGFQPLANWIFAWASSIPVSAMAPRLLSGATERTDKGGSYREEEREDAASKMSIGMHHRLLPTTTTMTATRAPVTPAQEAQHALDAFYRKSTASSPSPAPVYSHHRRRIHKTRRDNGRGPSSRAPTFIGDQDAMSVNLGGTGAIGNEDDDDNPMHSLETYVDALPARELLARRMNLASYLIMTVAVIGGLLTIAMGFIYVPVRFAAHPNALTRQTWLVIVLWVASGVNVLSHLMIFLCSRNTMFWAQDVLSGFGP